MNIFTGKKLFEGHQPIVTEELLLENNQNNPTKDIIAERFSQIGILEVEQLLAIANTEKKKRLLANTLALDLGLVQSLVDKSQSEINPGSAAYYQQEGPIRPMGLELNDDIHLINEALGDSDFKAVTMGDTHQDNWATKLATSLAQHTPTSGSISHTDFIPFVKDQGQHPTCAAFAATASNEFRVTYILHNYNRGYLYLSESSIFCEAKKNDSIDYQNGTTLLHISNIIGQKGQARSTLYPYESREANICSSHTYRQSINSGDLLNQRAGIISVNPRSIMALKSALENKHLPYIGLELFESVWNRRTNENGFLTMPLKGETSQGGHAVCLVGYFDDISLPGGGAFIFKNSWGTSWSFNNAINRPGFGFVSYNYIANHCNQAFLTV